MLEYTIIITLTLEGPVLTHSTAAGEYGIDSPMARNKDEKYYLPGTLVKGKLREAMDELREKAEDIFNPNIVDLFGDKTGNEENAGPTVSPRRSRLIFEDFLGETASDSDNLTRIKIDQHLGSVKKGMLQVMEAPWASGKAVAFTGSISFIAQDQTEGDEIRSHIETGLRWITGFGSNRSVGFGRLLNVDIQVDTPIDLRATSDLDDLGSLVRIDLAISPRNPFCISKHRVSPNIFESEKIIPGNVIKGCIAELWRQLLGQPHDIPVNVFNDPARQELKDNFDRIRFTHAFPAPVARKKRPVVAPLSLVRANKHLHDVALCKNPVLIGDDKSAPEFSIDWKSSDDVDLEFGWKDSDTSLKTELRVRTKINSQYRRAEDKQLFAYEMVVPTDHIWYCSVDLSAITSSVVRATVLKQLQQLLKPGLRWLGKTKTRADVTIFKPDSGISACIESKSSPQDDCWIVTLQTPAILCNPYDLNETSGAKQLEANYKAVWQQLSDNNLELSHYFAGQSLAGGFYTHRRFRSSNPADYYPFLLTDAGSVFVLKAAGPNAQQFIEAWLKQGLPLPDWAKSEYARNGHEGDHWENCPYIRQNGYGKIAVNLDHPVQKLKEGDCHAIKSLAD